MAKSVPQTRTAWAVLMASLSRINFDPGYSTLLADLLLTSDTTRNRTDTAAIDASFLMRKSHEGHWAAPEFIRVQTHLLSETKSSTEKELTAALSLARRQGAHAWELKIAVDLAETLLEGRRWQKAREVLDAAMLSFPNGRRSHTWNSAVALQRPDAFMLLDLLRYCRLRLPTSSGVTRPVLPPKCPIT